MSDQEYIVDVNWDPVPPKPTKEEFASNIEFTNHGGETPEEPAPGKPAQRRANFAMPPEGEGGEHDSSWRID